MAAKLANVNGIRIWHDQALIKEPWGNPTGWHLDNPKWSYNSKNTLTIWIALDDATLSNGCMYFIPGSHKMTFDKSFFNEKGFFKTSCNRELVSRKIDISLNQGDLLVFHCRTLHSAGWNRGSSAKLSLVFTYYHPSNLPVVVTRSASIDPIQIG